LKDGGGGKICFMALVLEKKRENIRLFFFDWCCNLLVYLQSI